MIPDNVYREKMMACWLGKAVGGTLGMPYEGVTRCLDLSYYDPVPTEMLPNDDLDLQVVDAFLNDRMDQPAVDRHVLVQSWQHIGMSPDEYGTCKLNIARGLHPPYTGSFDNWFAAGMGAAIRTELWACLAPGDPELAAAYAYEDACMDHAGEGIHAPTFLAALQSLAFVESDHDILLDRSLALIPADSDVRRAIEDTRVWWHDLHDWKQVQMLIMQHHGHENFTNVTHNLAFTILGYLASKDNDLDLGTGICTAVNCGQDTDCTGATLGALLGILKPDCITEHWLKPIGRQLVLSPSITGVDHPPTLDGFTELVADLRRRINGAKPTATTPAPRLEAFAIAAEMTYQPGVFAEQPQRSPRVDHWQPVTLPGLVVQREADAARPGDVVLRYPVSLPVEQEVRVVFNSHEANRLYIDGKLAFSGSTGRMCPAIHRPPADQHIDLTLAAGTHELVAVIQRIDPARPLEWFCGIGDVTSGPLCGHWLPEAFTLTRATDNR